MLLNIGERRRFVYRIAVLTDLKHEGEHYAKVINDYCINQKLFPLHNAGIFERKTPQYDGAPIDGTMPGSPHQ